MLSSTSTEVGSTAEQTKKDSIQANADTESNINRASTTMNELINNSKDDHNNLTDSQSSSKSDNLTNELKEEDSNHLESGLQNFASALLGELPNNENEANDKTNIDTANSPNDNPKLDTNKDNGNSNVVEKKDTTSESDEEDISEKSDPNEPKSSHEINDGNESEKEKFTSTLPLDDFESPQKISDTNEQDESKSNNLTNEEETQNASETIKQDESKIDDFTNEKETKNELETIKQDENSRDDATEQITQDINRKDIPNKNELNGEDSNLQPVQVNIEITDHDDSNLMQDQQNKNNSEKDESSTFATNPTKIDIKLTNGQPNHLALSSASSTSRSNRSTNAFYNDELSPRSRFKIMIYGDPSKKAQANLTRSYYNALRNRSNRGSSQVDPSIIQSTADALLNGKPLKVSDPYEVADIIDDLNGRKIEALANNDYKTSQKIKDTIDSTRKQFRINDRERFHKKMIAKLEERNNESIQDLTTTKQKWKKEHKIHQQQNTQSLIDLQNRHQAQHEQLETDWTQPKIIHKFDKRSPVLLDMRQKEHYMLLAGMYTEADKMKRINSQLEKREINDRKFEMGHHFKLARSTLIHKQSEEVDNVKMDIAIGDDILNMRERREVDVKLKRLQATKRNLEDEKNVDNFVAKTFKRPKTAVMPSTVMVSRDKYDDIPVRSRGNSTMSHNAQDMMNIRKKNIVTPLPIQPLAIKKYKTQKIVKAPK